MPKSTRAQRASTRAAQTASIRESNPPTSSSTLPIYFHSPHTAPYGFLSQWYPSPMHDSAVNITYNCAEQRMMHHKALLCSDLASATAILASSLPGEQKMLGRKVKDWRKFEKEWEKRKFEVVVEGNLLKFGQGWLRGRLLATGERELVEAAGRDRVWGVGFAEGVAGANRDGWGQNLLGKALMCVRERIRGEEEGEEKGEKEAREEGREGRGDEGGGGGWVKE